MSWSIEDLFFLVDARISGSIEFGFGLREMLWVFVMVFFLLIVSLEIVRRCGILNSFSLGIRVSAVMGLIAEFTIAFDQITPSIFLLA